MKIVRDTPDQLIIENKAWLIGIILGIVVLATIGAGFAAFSSGEPTPGIIMILVGIFFCGGFFAIFVRRNQLVLDRAANSVEMRRRTVFGYKKRHYLLSNLDRATVQTSHSDDSETHRMALVFTGEDAGTHAFTAVYTSGKGARRGADAVNRWLDSTRARA